MRKIYYLSTCDTCRRILKELNPPSSYVLQDIKKDPITADQLEALKEKTGSYEKLLNKRARIYKERDLKNKELTPDDIKNLLLEHYTFLKRPVILIDEAIFVGNAKNTVAAAKHEMHE